MTNNELSPDAPLPESPFLVSPVWKILAAAGITLAACAFANLAVGWLPPRFRNEYWRFLVSGATIDGFPVVTAGAAAVFASLFVRGNASRLRLFAWLAGALGLGLTGVYVAFLTTLPRVHEMAQSAADAETVRQGVMRSSISAVVMVLLLAGLGFAAWKRSAGARRA